MSTAYTWQVISVDIAENMFVVEYKSDGKPVVHLNLPLPTALSTIKSTVESTAPIQMWAQSVKKAPSQLLITDVMAQSGAGVIAPPDPVALAAAGNDEFKKRVCQVLFDIGVTPTNKYIAPA